MTLSKVCTVSDAKSGGYFDGIPRSVEIGLILIDTAVNTVHKVNILKLILPPE